jgi:hypothetical protein
MSYLSPDFTAKDQGYKKAGVRRKPGTVLQPMDLNKDQNTGDGKNNKPAASWKRVFAWLRDKRELLGLTISVPCAMRAPWGVTIVVLLQKYQEQHVLEDENRISNARTDGPRPKSLAQLKVANYSIAIKLRTYTTEDTSWNPGSCFKAKLGRVLSICTKVEKKR